MSLISSRTHVRSRAAAHDLRSLVRRLWQDRLHRRAARQSLAFLLDRSDDRLLDDVGVDRETAHRLMGETMVVPHRAWDRWQG